MSITISANGTLCIIVAIDSCNGIGINNTLPWYLPEDLLHFKRTTFGHTIIMGRKTFESIGRPLPDRNNIVITHNKQWQHVNVKKATSLQEAIKFTNNTKAFIIGGAQIYTAAIPLATHLIVTRINKHFTCDTFFPMIDSSTWKEINPIHSYITQEFKYTVVIYERYSK